MNFDLEPRLSFGELVEMMVDADLDRLSGMTAAVQMHRSR
jgi:hypothetical protein